MAILSFKHLKNQKPGEAIPATIPAPIPEAKKAMPVVEQPPPPSRTTYRIPSVMPTALLCATNYCQGCHRYLPASERDKAALQIKYGQCLREAKSPESIPGEEPIMVEVWKNIPESATVSKCYFNQKEK